MKESYHEKQVRIGREGSWLNAKFLGPVLILVILYNIELRTGFGAKLVSVLGF